MLNKKMCAIHFDMNSLAKNLENLIKERGLTYRAVSLAAGKNQQFVADIVAGRSKSPTIDAVSSIARALDVPISRLTGEKPNYKPDVEILSACLLWVLQNTDKLQFMPHEQVVDELMRQYVKMLNDRINDKMEAVRITR